MGLAIKKTLFADEVQSERVQSLRKSFKADTEILDGNRIIFIDEVGFSVKMTRSHGRSKKGAPLISTVPGTWGKNLSMIGAMSCAGLYSSMIIDGSFTGEAVKTYLEKVLQKELIKGDTVIMDNASIHKVKGVEKIITDAGAQLIYLPPYSPDLNPIEKVWAKLKSRMRGLGLRTLKKVEDGIGMGLNLITESDCRAWVKHAGY